MAELGKYFEREELGKGRFRELLSLKPIAFLDGGRYKRIAAEFKPGDLNNPNIVDDAPFLSRIDAAGNWRVHPTRDPDIWFSIGAPFINPANPTRVSLNPFSREGSVLTSVNPNFDARILHAGHYLKLEFQLKNGFVPPQGRVAFPLDARGVTRVGSELRVGGVTVMQLTKPVVYDANHPEDVRDITVTFQSVGGQLYAIYTLPSLTGMSAPVIDPTLTLQPDGTDGQDTMIAQNQATTNFGSNANLNIGEQTGATQNYRTLIKFDLSGLSGTAVISSASLIMRVNADNSSNARTYRVYRQKRAWVEAQATWNIYATGNNWSTAGGFHSDDCEQTEIGSCAFTATESIGTLKTFVLTPTSKAALDLGNGWLIKADTESDDSYRFDSSDATTAGNRPKLEIVYSIPALDAAQGAYGVAGQPAGLSFERKIFPVAGSYAQSGQNLALLKSSRLDGAQGSYALNGQAAGIAAGKFLWLTPGAQALNGQAVLIFADRLLALAQGDHALNGQTVTFNKGFTLALAHGTLGLSGQAVLLTAARLLALAHGAYAYEGQSIILNKGVILDLLHGAYALSGQPLGLAADRLVALGGETYALGGQPIILNKGVILALAPGSHALSGQGLTLFADRLAEFSFGAHALTGQSLILNKGVILVLNNGSLNINGQPLGLSAARQVGLSEGVFALGGQALGLPKDSLLAPAPGALNVDGKATGLARGVYLLGVTGLHGLDGKATDLLFGRQLAFSIGSYDVYGQILDISIVVTILVPTPTPEQRILRVGGEHRIIAIDKDKRIYTVARDIRILVVED